MVNIESKIYDGDNSVINRIIYQTQSIKFESLDSLNFDKMISNLENLPNFEFLEKTLENKKIQKEALKTKIKNTN